jgi:Tfp pilus assembly protein PilX
MNKVIKYLQKIFTIAPSIGRKGSALMATIVSITVLGILAAAIMYIVSSSSNVPAGADLSMRAFYLAESGIRYIDPPDTQPVEAAVNGSASVANSCMSQSNPTQCLQNLASCLNHPTSTCLTSNTEYVNPAYTSNTYSLDGGNTTIALAASYIAGPPQQIQLTSTATVYPSSSGEGQSAQTSTRTITLQSDSITFNLTDCDVITNSFSSFGTVTVTVPPGGGSATFTVSPNPAALGSVATVGDIFFNTTPPALTSSLNTSGTITTNAPSIYVLQSEGNEGASSFGTYDWKIDTGGGGADPGSAGLSSNFYVKITNANITSASNFVQGVLGSAGLSTVTFYTAVKIMDVTPADLYTSGTGATTRWFGARAYAPGP